MVICFFSFFFALVSCKPIYTKYNYSISSTIEHIDVTFDKSIATERRLIELPCGKTFVIIKNATYSKKCKNVICIDSIISSNAFDSNGRIIKLDSIYKSSCVDSLINAFAEYNNKNWHNKPLDKIEDKEYIRKECFLESFLKPNDTILYCKQYPKYIINLNASWIGCADTIININDILQFDRYCNIKRVNK